MSGFDVRKIIDTDAHSEVKQNNFEPLDKFLYDYLNGECEFYDVEEGDELSSQKWIHDEIEVSRQDFYQKYVEFCRLHAPKALLDSSQNKIHYGVSKNISLPRKI